MQLMNIEWKWNIPNLLSLLRILLVPVFVILYLLSSDERMDLMYWSFGVLILSGVTDSLDGIIARKCNQITDLGKLLDPVADKLTQVAVGDLPGHPLFSADPPGLSFALSRSWPRASAASSCCGGGRRCGAPPGMVRCAPLCSTG